MIKTYKYYENDDPTTKTTDKKRIKRQISKIDTTSTSIYYRDVITDYKKSTWGGGNYAGYDCGSESDYGGKYWIVSPWTEQSQSAFCCCSEGNIDITNWWVACVNLGCFAVAPLFCI